MKKKIILSILFIMVISLSAAFGAIGEWNLGDHYIPCYLYESVYSYPTTAIAPGANGQPGQTISFDIPSNLCPPSKTIRIGGPEDGEAKNSQHIVMNVHFHRTRDVASAIIVGIIL